MYVPMPATADCAAGDTYAVQKQYAGCLQGNLCKRTLQVTDAVAGFNSFRMFAQRLIGMHVQ
jgi:hypothetical protein